MRACRLHRCRSTGTERVGPGTTGSRVGSVVSASRVRLSARSPLNRLGLSPRGGGRRPAPAGARRLSAQAERGVDVRAVLDHRLLCRRAGRPRAHARSGAARAGTAQARPCGATGGGSRSARAGRRPRRADVIAPVATPCSSPRARRAAWPPSTTRASSWRAPPRRRDHGGRDHTTAPGGRLRPCIALEVAARHRPRRTRPASAVADVSRVIP